MKIDSDESSNVEEKSYKELFSHMINGFALHKIILNKKIIDIICFEAIIE
jgi:hypothetical protein